MIITLNNRIDGFGMFNGRFYGHTKDCLGIFKEGNQVIKIVFKNKDEENIHLNSLKNEYDILKNLDHPGVIEVDRFIEEEEFAYYNMPYYGKSLSDRLASKLNEEKQIFLNKIEEIVKYMYSNNVVHRDLNISNFLVNDNDQPILIDFQVAKKLKQECIFKDSLDYCKNEQVNSCCGNFISVNLNNLRGIIF